MSFARYETYRDSCIQWIGSLPSEWAICRLGSECETIVPMRDKPAHLGGQIPWIRIEDFDGKFIGTSKSGQGVSVETVDSMNLKVLPVGSVLCSCSCTMGATAIVTRPLITNQTFIGIVPGHGLTSDFLFYLFAAASDHLNSIGTGAIQSYLSRDDFRQLRIPKPSHEEQVQIAAFLDLESAKIDALVAEQQKLIALLKEKRQAVISHAVTKGLDPSVPMKDSGADWMGHVPAHWQVTRLAHGASIENGTTPSRNNPAYWIDGDVPWLSSGEVNQYRITEATEFITAQALQQCSLRLLPKGTIVIGMIGQGKTRGLSASLEIEACINQNLAAIIPGKKLASDYLLYVFQSVYEYLREFGRGGNQAALNCEILAALRIPFPPLGEQLHICEYLEARLNQFSTLTAGAERAIELLQERRTALISAAVTGKIKVTAN